MSSKNEAKEVEQRFGFQPEEIIGSVVLNKYKIDRYLGHGTVGVVFHGVDEEIGDAAAIKIIPQKTLKDDWEIELKKLSKLVRINSVVQCKGYGSEIVSRKRLPCICIAYEYIEGSTLKKYAEVHPELITIEFVKDLIVESLNVFKACGKTGITHGDFHEGNIIIANPDDRILNPRPTILINDFGIGGTTNILNPEDDYLQLSRMCTRLIQNFVDPAKLDGEDKFFRDRLLEDFLRKQLVEGNPAVVDGEYVRNAEQLYKNLQDIPKQYSLRMQHLQGKKLNRPFDYLSCEQIGASITLLQTLYSNEFPGYEDLLEPTNTLLTGPRGCGKSTIFRNLSFKIQLLGGKNIPVRQFVGFYYNCNDLYYAFPYNIKNLDENAQSAITHYFNLSILTEILDSFAVFEELGDALPQALGEKLHEELKKVFNNFEHPPVGVSMLRHLLAQIVEEKEKFRALIDKNGPNFRPEISLRQDFLQKLSNLFQNNVSWLNGIPFYIFLDDYSTPRVSKEIQATLNSFVLSRSGDLFFKISTESLVSIYPYDATGKLLEKNREYDVIDLGDYFLYSDFPRDTNLRDSKFLSKIINSRLENAVDFSWTPKDITQILGGRQFSTWNELALAIRDEEKKLRITYGGWDTVVELCSGDIANILKMIRDMFTAAEAEGLSEGVIPLRIQNRIIRETGNDFLNKIERATETGKQLRHIAQAFGSVAHYYLKKYTSKNVDQEPPMQASRIEIRETPYFDIDPKQQKFEQNNQDAKKLYEDLIKYGIFIQDVRGKSQRGAVVPRLYLRRLLIPAFLLTPSKRDNISLEVEEFKMLLTNPQEWETHMKAKGRRIRKRSKKITGKRQGRLS